MSSVLAYRNFRLFWAGGVLSVAGDWMLLTALPFYVYSLTGSAAATSAMYVAYAVPRLLLGLLGGTLVDRFDRRRTMIFCDVSRSVLLLPLLFVETRSTLWILIAVSAVQSAIGQLFFPARHALLPALVPQDARVRANSLDSLSMGLTRLVGPISGGVLLAGFGIRSVVVIDAMSFMLSAGLLWRMRVPLTIASPLPHPRPAVLRDLVSGLQLCWHRRIVRGVLGLSGVVMIGYGLMSVLTVVFVQTDLDRSAAAFGWMLAAQGVGITVTGLLGTRLGPRIPAPRLYAGGLVVAGLSMLVTFQARTLPVALVAFALSGAGLSAWMIGERTLLQGAVRSTQLGRLFGTYNTVTSVLMLAGTMAAGVLGTAWGARTVLTLASALYLVPGLIGLGVLARARVRPTAVADVVKRREAA